MDINIESLSLDDIPDLNKLSINENPEYLKIVNNIREIEKYNKKTILTKINTEFVILINNLYTQNQIYLEKITFDPNKYTNCKQLPDFTSEQKYHLQQSKYYLDEANAIFESIPTNNKLWNIRNTYNAMKYCKKAYELILLII